MDVKPQKHFLTWIKIDLLQNKSMKYVCLKNIFNCIEIFLWRCLDVTKNIVNISCLYCVHKQ